MIKTQKILCALAASLVLATPARAAPHPELGKPFIDRWSVDDYPSRSHQNWDVRLDPAGRVWVGSSSGVQYYDGSRWQLIKTPHSSIAYSMLPLGDGRVYLGSTSNLGYLEAGPRAEWLFVSLTEGHDIPQFGNILTVEKCSADIFFHSDRLLLRYSPATDELRWVEARGRFLRIRAAGDQLYVADEGHGIFRYDTADDELVPVLEWSAFGGSEFRLLTHGVEEGLLVLTSSGFFELAGGSLRRVATEIDDWLGTQLPYKATRLADGNLVVGSRRGGLVVLDPQGRLLRRISSSHGLPWPWVCDAALDPQGGLWASHNGGISRIDIDPVFSYFDESVGVHSVQALSRHRGRLVAATQEGLQVLTASPDPGGQARFMPLAGAGVQTWSLLDTGDQLLYGDSGGIVAMRLGQGGEVSPERIYEGRRAVHLAASPGDPDEVFAALEDGVARLRRVGGGWRSEGKLIGLDVPVIFVEQEADGSLWFGTITGTYSRVRSLEDWPRADIETFGAAAGVPNGNSHLFRAGGEILFGTYDGFSRFTGERFEPDPRFPKELIDGSRDIHRLQEDASGRLWIYAAGRTGVATPKPAGGWTFDERPLRRMSSEKVSAIHVDPGGVVWLGRRSGVVRFDPALWRPPEPLPPTRIRRVSLPGDPVPLFGGAAPAESFEAPALGPGQSSLRFAYAVADFAPPHALQYRTRLEGVDRDWSEWSEETQRDFTSLPPGRRAFRVQARNSLGQLAPEDVFHLQLTPPWFRSWWAYLGYGAAAVLLMVGSAGWAARRRTARLEIERRRLSALVDQRTAEIRRQTEALSAEHEAKSRFFTNVSHELRTPLTLTLGPLEDAAAGRLGDIPTPVAESVDTALRNARQLRNLVDQVLDIGRLEAGRMPLAACKGDLGALVRRVAGRFPDAAERAAIRLDLSGLEDGVEVWLDPIHMDRVVSNLLANALKFTPAGGRVSVRVERRRRTAELTVADSGVGIEQRDLPRIFDRYFQAGHSVAEQPGTGIGLALVRELVELHGGQVTADSMVGEGSTFTVTLPLGRGHLKPDQVAETAVWQAETVAPVAAAASADPAPGDELVAEDATTLLIADDNAELRGFLRQRFAGRYRILEAADGREALDRCRRSPPDLVISDVMMPEMDGLELTRRLKADPDLAFVPIILLTARAASEDAVAGLGVGADDYLRKPFDSPELEARVERLITSRRQLRARFAAPEPATGLSGADAEFDRRLLAGMQQLLEAGDLTVQALANALAMDRSHLYRRVQAVRGQSPQDLIRQTRLQAAARMLATGEGMVTEIAYSVGFKSLGHFSETFRRHFGIPPSKWQQQSLAPPSSLAAS